MTMQKVKVGSVLRLDGGCKLRLSPDQIRRRVNVLQELEDRPGVYLLLGQTQFKVGEEFEIEDMPRSAHAALGIERAKPVDKQPEPKRRGRPPGSKNKPKAEPKAED